MPKPRPLGTPKAAVFLTWPSSRPTLHDSDQKDMRLGLEDGLLRDPVDLVGDTFRAATALGLRRRAIRPNGFAIR